MVVDDGSGSCSCSCGWVGVVLRLKKKSICTVLLYLRHFGFFFFFLIVYNSLLIKNIYSFPTRFKFDTLILCFLFDINTNHNITTRINDRTNVKINLAIHPSKQSNVEQIESLPLPSTFYLLTLTLSFARWHCLKYRL